MIYEDKHINSDEKIINLSALAQLQEGTKYSTEEFIECLRTIANLLEESKKEEPIEEPGHICSNCRYRHILQERYYDSQGEIYCHPIIAESCTKDERILNKYVKNCNLFECGDPIVEDYAEKIRRK